MTVINLPYSTAECSEGPTIYFHLGHCRVRYDAEDSSGRVVWTEVRFDGALAVKFTPEAFVTADMVGAYSKVSAWENSPWIAALVAHGSNPFPDSIRHFLMYFDHEGCFEVLARAVEIQDASNSRSEGQ